MTQRLISRATLLLSCLLPLVLGACAQNVRSNVTVYQRLDSMPGAIESPKTYTIALDPEQAKSLEFAQYQDLLVQELGPLGFSGAPTGQTGRYRIEFQVRSTDQRTTFTDYAYPTFGVGVTRGFYGYGYYGGRGFYDPFFTAPVPVQRSYEFTRHELQVRIFDTQLKDSKAIWEGKAVTDSNRDSLAEAMPYLTRSVFTGFPGENGRTRTVTIPRAPKP